MQNKLCEKKNAFLCFCPDTNRSMGIYRLKPVRKKNKKNSNAIEKEIDLMKIRHYQSQTCTDRQYLKVYIQKQAHTYCSVTTCFYHLISMTTY